MLGLVQASLLRKEGTLQSVFEVCVSSVSEIGIGAKIWTLVSRLVSLVPRLRRSGTRTLKLCRRGEPGKAQKVERR